MVIIFSLYLVDIHIMYSPQSFLLVLFGKRVRDRKRTSPNPFYNLHIGATIGLVK